MMNRKYFLISIIICSNCFAEKFPFSKSADEEFKKGFGESKGISLSEKNQSEDDKFKIGGTLTNEFIYTDVGSSLSNPNTLWLYGDSRLKNEIRGYVKGKLIYDPTLNETKLNPYTGKLYKKEETTLDEAKLQMNLKKTVFFTLGKQKIKWGTGRFWNPTDFINNLKRDLLESGDDRSGVGLVKAHFPIETTNLYAIGLLDDADKTNKIGNALRLEHAFTNMEWGFSYADQKGRSTQMGVDLSTAFFDFDIYGELAYQKGSDKTFYENTGASYQRGDDIYNWVLGINYDYKYSDDDTLSFNVEYFSNDESQKNISEYTYTILSRQYTPYYLSQDYLMNSLYLGKPGSFNDYAFSVINLSNLSDHSHLGRLEIIYSGIQDLNLTTSVSYHYGNQNGELMMGGQEYDLALKTKIDF